jgi:uncharacterized membrane protein (DUF373 family)
MFIEKIMGNYNFTSRDESNLHKMAPMMEKRAEAFVETFYRNSMKFSNASKYLNNEEVIDKHKSAIKEWYLRMFNGPFDENYLYYLERIGYSHVKVSLPSHYVNVTISQVREFCTAVVVEEVSGGDERRDLLQTLRKILDINLDVLTSSYIQEERNIYFLSKKAESKLIEFAKRFSYGLNLVLVMGLVALGIMVLGLFAYDLTHIFAGNIEKGLLGTLGSLLMLWVVIELVDTEVDHLKGAKFSIKVFISVAMVALIRKILVASLKSGEAALQSQYALIAAMLVLGVLYWIISKAESEK